VDAAAADAGQAAHGEVEEGLGERGGHEAAEGVHVHARQQHRALPVPADGSAEVRGQRSQGAAGEWNVWGGTGRTRLLPPAIPAAGRPCRPSGRTAASRPTHTPTDTHTHTHTHTHSQTLKELLTNTDYMFFWFQE